MPNDGSKDEEQALNRQYQHANSDATSLRSFASSSTLLSSPISPVEEKFIFDTHVHEIDRQPIPKPSWRKTPLTVRGLGGLLWRLLTPLLLILVPSFLRHDHPPQPPRKLHPTSYLDGLRGIAALIVFIDHFSVHWFENLKFGYLSAPEHAYFVQLPIVRLIYSGRASVGVFFVISGFVLSHKPIRLIREGGDVAAVLGSSVFRRGMRLYLPILAGTFISAVLAYHGYYLDVPTRAEPIPPRFPTFRQQVWHWWSTMAQITFPFTDPVPNAPYSPPYNGHLWTIPIEFYGSMVVFVAVLGMSQVMTGCRMVFAGALAIWALGRERWDLFLFLSGMSLAEINLWNHPPPVPVLKSVAEGELPFYRHPINEDPPLILDILTHQLVQTLNSGPLRILSKLGVLLFRKSKGLLNLSLLFLALFLLSFAGDGFHPGIYHLKLQDWTPNAYLMLWYGHERFWISIGSALLVFSLGNSRWCQEVFETDFAQYLGDISYSLYIVHGMVLFTIGTNLMERWTGAVGKMTLNEWGQDILVTEWTADEWQYRKAFLMCGIINTVVAFWAADLFWRTVDRRAVMLSRGVSMESWMVGGKRR